MDSALPFQATSQKQLLIGVAWTSPDSSGTLEFLAPLSIDRKTVGRLPLRGTCSQRFPDESLMLQLETGTSDARTRIPLIRLDWRPFSKPHKNPKVSPGTTSRLIWGTHVHCFEENWLHAGQRMRTRNLRYADPISPEPESFEAVVDLAATLFRIDDLKRIERPMWSSRLV